MDDFREWLSDNLRYIMLGVGIILVLLLIFFGIRFVTGWITEPLDDQIQTEEDADADLPTPTATPVPEETPAASDKLQKNAVPEVFTLIGTYYNAIATKDVETIRGLVDHLTAEDEATITSNTVEAYSNINVYTRAHTNGSYAAFVSYKYKLSGIGTLVPGLSQLYICPKDDGSLYISTAAPNAEAQSFIDTAVKSLEVQALVSQIQSEYDAALASDPVLNAYFNPEAAPTHQSQADETTAPVQEPEAAPTPTPEATPTPEPEPEPEPETVVLKQSANFRDAPSNDSNIIDGIKKGTEMLKLGEKGGWFHVRINGQDGYIAARFF